MEIEFKIVYWETRKPIYDFYVDGKKDMEVKKGELRNIISKMEKYMRLRFVGEELSHHKKKEKK